MHDIIYWLLWRHFIHYHPQIFIVTATTFNCLQLKLKGNFFLCLVFGWLDTADSGVSSSPVSTLVVETVIISCLKVQILMMFYFFGCIYFQELPMHLKSLCSVYALWFCWFVVHNSIYINRSRKGYLLHIQSKE